MKRGVECEGVVLKEIKQNCPAQYDVLIRLTKRGQTPRQIAYYRRTSVSAVYKTIKILKEKGVLEGSMKRAWKQVRPLSEAGGRISNPGEPYNLHAEHWKMNLATINSDYRWQMKTRPVFNFEGNKVLLHKESIQVRSHQDFSGRDQRHAERRSATYWPGYFKRLSDYLGVTWRHVERCNAHYAFMNSTIARRPEYREEKLMVRHKGKVIFITDGSIGVEDEAIGKKSNIMREAIDKLIEDRYVHPDAPVLSEQYALLCKTITAVSKLGEGLAEMNKAVEKVSGLKGIEGAEPLGKDKPRYLG